MNHQGFIRHTGLSLVEVVMAIGIVSFAILTLVALLPVGLKTIRESSDEAAAVNHLAILATDVKSVPVGTNLSLRFGIPAGTNLSVAGSFYLDQGGSVRLVSSEARFVVDWRVIPGTNTLAPSHVNLRLGWPAAAAEPSGFVETVVTLPVECP